MKTSDPKGPWALYSSHLGGYMRRWILRTPWFTLRLHNILKSDEGRDFHDHPFHFTSFILRGGYIEHRPGCRCCWTAGGNCICTTPCGRFAPGDVVRRKAADFHRLELSDGPAWTFVISSRYFRPWGFLTPTGWVGYQEYHRSFYNDAPADGEP